MEDRKLPIATSNQLFLTELLIKGSSIRSRAISGIDLFIDTKFAFPPSAKIAYYKI